ncbi:MAG: efflux RND transporter permease subunit [Deltaproteobacteria bacterium]|nr:MAG: efflux RND transporter permease subunit [Deltaproteobacteria bacterium]
MIGRIIELCARNRLAVLAGVAIATGAALWSIRHLKLDAIPDLGDTQVIIYSEWMGRSPILVEDQVTYPIVSTLVGAPKVADVRGYSMFGMSFVHVVFQEGTDPYWARSRVLEYMNSLRARLPEGVSPALGPDASSVGWAFQYTLVDASGRNALDELRTFQDFTLRYAIGQVPGVAEVASVGGFQRQYQVTIDPDRLRAYGVSVEEVISRIRDSNADVGGRVLEFAGREYYVQGRGYIQDLGAIERTALRTRGPLGAPILVKDVATVRFGPDIRRGLLEWNGDGEAVGGIVLVRQGENVLEVIGRVKQKIAELARSLPAGVKVEVAYDRTGLIERSIATLEKALVEEAIVVALVVILFLFHFRSALLPIISIPIAVALSFIPMVLFDIPATIMSLGGIAIAIGATVDAEIVMIEASHRKLAGAPPGTDRNRLLGEAAREVTPAIFFSLLIIAAGFLPVFTLTGQAGRLFRPLACTKTFVMLSAALLSVTFAPALRGFFLRGRIRSEAEHPISRALTRIYRPFVFVALRRPRSTLAIGLLAVLSAVPLARRLGHEFMPALDEGDVLYMPTTFPNLSIEEAKRQVQVQDRILRSFPEVASVFGKAGRADSATDPAPLTMVETTVRLKPVQDWRMLPRRRWYSAWAPGLLARALRPIWPDHRRITPAELTALMNDALQLPGWTNAFTMPIKARVDMLSTGIRTPVGVKIMGTDLAEIEKAGVRLEALLKPIGGTRSVLYERNQGGLYIDIVPLRDALGRYGLTVGDVERTIESAIGGAPIGVTVEGRNRFSINVRYPQDARSDLERLRGVLVAIAPAEGAATPTAEAVAVAQSEPDHAQHPSDGAPPLRPVGGRSAVQWQSVDPAALQGLTGEGVTTAAKRGFVSLGQVADIRIVGGPPMVRDEGGLLVGYVFVDVDPSQRDLGGYVSEAKQVVQAALADGRLKMPQGYFLKWTGQYEELEKMATRMRLIVPAALLLIVVLLFLHFRNLIEVLIVLLSVPFALAGSVWLLWLLDYRLSTAVWVGVIALVGLAAQTGIVMIVYIDNAYQRRKSAGRIRDLSDIIRAHMEGTVQRVRPKLMTVAAMLGGLVPLLWATGSGAEVMKRMAAPMVGGLITSALLTLEIIPVVYTYWRQEQLLWERVADLDGALLRALRVWARVQGAGWTLLLATGASLLYVDLAAPIRLWAFTASAGLIAIGAAGYLRERPAARRLVWPAAEAVEGIPAVFSS